MTGTSNNNPTRRTALATLAGASVVTPYLWTRSASAAQQLVVRTPGGVFDDVKRETVYEPFRKATGIEIVPVPATVAKLLAMFRSGPDGDRPHRHGRRHAAPTGYSRGVDAPRLLGLQVHQSRGPRSGHQAKGAGRQLRLRHDYGLSTRALIPRARSRSPGQSSGTSRRSPGRVRLRTWRLERQTSSSP